MSTTSEKKTELETVEELYRLLTDHQTPEGMTISNLPPKMTGEQAFSLIWYLQEGPRCLPDHIERCDGCGDLIDSDGESVEYVESKGQRLCESCYRAEHAFRCCACDNHDCHSAPGRLAVVGEEVQRLKPGLYKITRWPFYADGMIEMHIYESSFQFVGPAPEKADTDGYPMGFLCAACEKASLSNTEVSEVAVADQTKTRGVRPPLSLD